MLVGPLCASPDGEFFAVITNVIEVFDAEQTQVSLAFTGRSWSRIQSLVRAIQAQPNMAAWRILGQAHGHPFGPRHDGQQCDKCPDAAECQRTSAFVSTDDLAWQQAVFAGQPWGVAHIFGQDARGGPVNSLFGLRDGTLLPRAYYLIEELETAAGANLKSQISNLKSQISNPKSQTGASEI